jgi:hypothetical protein
MTQTLDEYMAVIKERETLPVSHMFGVDCDQCGYPLRKIDFRIGIAYHVSHDVAPCLLTIGR